MRRVIITIYGHVTLDSTPFYEALRARSAGLFPQFEGLPWDTERTEVKNGGRPQSPDDIPIVSRSRCPNLFLNTGHGQIGWRLACTTSTVLTSLVTGLDLPQGYPGDVEERLSLARYDPAGAQQQR